MVVKKIKTKKAGIMTLEKLAIMVANGFESVDKRFENVDKRFEKVDLRLDGIEAKIDGINRRIDDISLNRVRYEDHDALKKRVSVLEKV